MPKSLTALLVVLAAAGAYAGNPPRSDVTLAVADVEAEVAPGPRRPRANGPVVTWIDLADDASPRRPRAGGTMILVSADPALPRPARANGTATLD